MKAVLWKLLLFAGLFLLLSQTAHAEDPPTPCDENPCENGGICEIVGVDGYECECVPDWVGTDCQLADPCTQDPSPCESYETCTIDIQLDGSEEEIAVPVCACPEGKIGEMCEYDDPCPEHECDPGFICEPDFLDPVTAVGKCVCENGKYGSGCTEDDPCDLNPCENDGICEPGYTNAEGYLCECAQGFLGDNCEYTDPCAEKTCPSLQKCEVDFGDGQSQPDGHCVCENGNFGLECTVETDPCDGPGSCGEGGTCSLDYDHPDGFVCECDPDWIGTLCDIEHPCVDFSEPCEAPRECILVIEEGGSEEDAEAVCGCASGYGPSCDIPSNPCDDENVCGEHGTCALDYDDPDGYECKCDPGYLGDKCEYVDPCLDYTCSTGFVCEPEFVDEDTADPKCVCQNGNWGFGCDQDDPCGADPCSIENPESQFVCVETYNNEAGFQCFCAEDFYGSECDKEAPCADTPCEHGTCEHLYDAPEGYRCECETDYLGFNCEYLDPCTETTCSEHLVCVTKFEDPGTAPEASCECQNGNFGLNCDVQEDRCEQEDICGDHGTCVLSYENTRAYDCDCGDSGYVGMDCEHEDPCSTTNDPCQNDGVCELTLDSTTGFPDGGAECDCSSTDFGGEFCDDRCLGEEYPCLHGGECVSDTESSTWECGCPLTWTGDSCETPVHPVSPEEIPMGGRLISVLLSFQWLDAENAVDSISSEDSCVDVAAALSDYLGDAVSEECVDCNHAPAVWTTNYSVTSEGEEGAVLPCAHSVTIFALVDQEDEEAFTALFLPSPADPEGDGGDGEDGTGDGNDFLLFSTALDLENLLLDVIYDKHLATDPPVDPFAEILSTPPAVQKNPEEPEPSPCDDVVCENFGACELSGSAQDVPVCRCAPGFEGEFCAERVETPLRGNHASIRPEEVALFYDGVRVEEPVPCSYGVEVQESIETTLADQLSDACTACNSRIAIFVGLGERVEDDDTGECAVVFNLILLGLSEDETAILDVAENDLPGLLQTLLAATGTAPTITDPSQRLLGTPGTAPGDEDDDEEFWEILWVRIVAGAVVLLLICLIVYCCRRSRKSSGAGTLGQAGTYADPFGSMEMTQEVNPNAFDSNQGLTGDDPALPEEDDDALPPNWTVQATADGRIFYWNVLTTESSWLRPTH